MTRRWALSMASFLSACGVHPQDESPTTTPTLPALSTAGPVVPGAYGYGMETRAAYACGTDPAILRVTNLDDSGEGSLRAALEADGPRVVVFEISGTIVLGSAIYIAHPCLTVAGQTAPAPGISVRGGAEDAMIEIDTHDVLMQHFRARASGGSDVCTSALGAWDERGYGFGERPYNVVFDHMSVSWGQDEGMYFSADNVTVWRSIMSEGLFQVPGSEGCGGGGLSNGHGLLVAGYAQNVAVVESVFAHNAARNPEIHGGTTTLVVNNVMYDFANANNEPAGTLFYAPDPSPFNAAIIGNTYVNGPTSATDKYAVAVWSGEPGSVLYLADNAVDGAMPYGNYLDFDPLVAAPSLDLPEGIAPMASADVEATVLPRAGARPIDRDAVDTRVILDVYNRTGSRITDPAEVGGWPELAVVQRAFETPDDPHAISATGYTNLEDTLHAYARELEGGE